jgi:hypothetical protein
MYYWSGGIIFFVLAVLVIVAFVKIKQRDRDYGEGRSEHSEQRSSGRTTPKGTHPQHPQKHHEH